MSKRKCPIENCCNADCHQSQKEIIECLRRNKVIGILKKKQNEFIDLVIITIENWLQQEGFYAEEFEDLFDLIRELKYETNNSN